MAYHPSEIANEFVSLAGHQLPQMKLQKLTFIANGWNLAISGEPLVDTTAEAWDNGPVFREIWDRIRDLGVTPDGHIRDYSGETCQAMLDSQERQVVAHVWRRYGNLSSQRLSELTHQPETPWTQAYFGRGRNAPIYNDEVEQHYRELALAGRAQHA